MAPLGWMLVYALFLWWFSTGVILFLNHLPPASFRYSLAGASVVLIVALIALSASTRQVSVAGAYLGFTCGLLAWGWQEMTFFMGAITGPRRTAEAGVRGWRRFWHGAQTCLYHEAAIAIVAVPIIVCSLGQPNKVGCWTYLALWAMRLSAKLNVFLGVRNLNEHFVPRRLAYLKAYMTRRAFNPLLPFSLMGGVAATALFGIRALVPGASAFDAVSAGFVATILGLGVIEHLFMVVPLPFAALWTGFATQCPVGADHEGSRLEKFLPHTNAAAGAPILARALPGAIERS